MVLNGLLDRLPLGNLRKPAPLVSAVRLYGAIGPVGLMRGGMSISSLAGALERAFSPKPLAAVALLVNSPGGSPAQSALIAGRIRQLAQEKRVPVFAFAEDVAASGGYWLASAADEIFATETSIIGSIGVISAGFGLQDLIARFGVERRLHTSGERKSFLDPFRPEEPRDVARLEAIQRELHESFKAQIRSRRGAKLKSPEDELFSGEFWTGRRALELGLIDGIGDLRSTLRQRFGEKVRIRLVADERSRLRRWLRLGAGGREGIVPTDWTAELVAALEAKALWSRFGL
jgi:signal peptide peptidase SppA